MDAKMSNNMPINCRVAPPLFAKLMRLTTIAGRSRSDVLRWLILRATPADLPAGWVESAAEARKLLVEVES
jgi:hypothetical protein